MPAPTKTLEIEIMGQEFLLNAIDLDDILDYGFVVRAAVEAAMGVAANGFDQLQAAAAQEDERAMGLASLNIAVEISSRFSPALMKELRPRVLSKALLKPSMMPVEKAFKEGLLAGGLGQVQAIFFHGVGLSFGPFGKEGTGAFLRAAGAVLSSSAGKSDAGGPSGASGPTA